MSEDFSTATEPDVLVGFLDQQRDALVRRVRLRRRRRSRARIVVRGTQPGGDRPDRGRDDRLRPALLLKSRWVARPPKSQFKNADQVKPSEFSIDLIRISGVLSVGAGIAIAVIAVIAFVA